VIDNPGNLIGKQAWIDRVIDRAETKNAVPNFQVTPRIPREGRYAVAEFDAVFLQPLRHLERTGANFRIIGRMDRPFDGARDDLTLAMVCGGMVNDAMAQQRPILHQAEHGIPLSIRRTIAPEIFSGARALSNLDRRPSPVWVKVSRRAGPCKGFVERLKGRGYPGSHGIAHKPSNNGQ
jgi:hypothetical protein